MQIGSITFYSIFFIGFVQFLSFGKICVVLRCLWIKQKLVISGPYGLCRNPMAVAGDRGLAVSLFTRGSYAVLLYVLLGAVVWHWFVRPIEEDMNNRFGEPYMQYKAESKMLDSPIVIFYLAVLEILIDDNFYHSLDLVFTKL